MSISIVCKITEKPRKYGVNMAKSANYMQTCLQLTCEFTKRNLANENLRKQQGFQGVFRRHTQV